MLYIICYTSDFEADMLLGIVKVSSLKLDQTKPGQTSKKNLAYTCTNQCTLKLVVTKSQCNLSTC